MEKHQLSQVDDYVKELARFYGDEVEPSDTPPPPPSSPISPAAAPGWSPDLNPTQQLIFDCTAGNILGHGEKGSGKTIGFAHKIIRHSYENQNALVLIIAPSMRTGNEGIWHDIDTLVLPAWKEGMGLDYTPSKLDPYTKDRHRWIQNRFGGWSKLLLMSIPHASMVQSRIKGPAPSMVYVDELTNCDGREYYIYPAAQLGRRRDITGPQQFCASCNPEGPSHWVYKLFWDEASVMSDGETKWSQDNGGVDYGDGVYRDPDYAVFHVKFTENQHRLPEGYSARLEKVLKTDPIERRRLIDGEWIDRPTGQGLFKDWFMPALHIRGDARNGIGLKPTPGFPIIVGYDLGPMWPSISFLQLIPTKSKPVWIIFDEIEHHGVRVLYKRLAWEVIDRMRHWKQICNGFDFSFMHITDESAVNQWRAGGEGSYDAYDFEREYNRVITEFGGREMRLIGCPKGKGSVAARVRLLQSKLYQEEIFISATCANTREMLMFLEDDPQDPGTPKRSKHIHKFDSLTYPMHKIEMSGGTKLFLHTDRVAPRLIRVGV